MAASPLTKQAVEVTLEINPCPMGNGLCSFHVQRCDLDGYDHTSCGFWSVVAGDCSAVCNSCGRLRWRGKRKKRKGGKSNGEDCAWIKPSFPPQVVFRDGDWRLPNNEPIFKPPGVVWCPDCTVA